MFHSRSCKAAAIPVARLGKRTWENNLALDRGIVKRTLPVLTDTTLPTDKLHRKLHNICAEQWRNQSTHCPTDAVFATKIR